MHFYREFYGTVSFGGKCDGWRVEEMSAYSAHFKNQIPLIFIRVEWICLWRCARTQFFSALSRRIERNFTGRKFYVNEALTKLLWSLEFRSGISIFDKFHLVQVERKILCTMQTEVRRCRLPIEYKVVSLKLSPRINRRNFAFLVEFPSFIGFRFSVCLIVVCSHSSSPSLQPSLSWRHLTLHKIQSNWIIVVNNNR